MSNRKYKILNYWLFIFIKVGFIFGGSIAGVLIGALPYTYLIPFWAHTEIDVGNRNFSDIVLVQYGYLENVDLSRDIVTLKTDDEKYYSYHQNQWQFTEKPIVDETKFPYNAPPCSEWPGPPPAVYLQKTKDSVGVEFEHALAFSSRCYVLLENGSLHVWTRTYGIFEMIFMGVVSLVIGMVIGGFFGDYVAKEITSNMIALD